MSVREACAYKVVRARHFRARDGTLTICNDWLVFTWQGMAGMLVPGGLELNIAA